VSAENPIITYKKLSNPEAIPNSRHGKITHVREIVYPSATFKGVKKSAPMHYVDRNGRYELPIGAPAPAPAGYFDNGSGYAPLDGFAEPIPHFNDTQRLLAEEQLEIALEAFKDVSRAGVTVLEARELLKVARDAATTAEEAVLNIKGNAEEKAKAVLAAVKARELAKSMEQYSHADQTLLDENITINMDTLQVALGGATSVTFQKNPNDTRGAIEYVIEAVNGSTRIEATSMVDNGDGTITATWGALPVGDGTGYVFVVTPTTFEKERASVSPSTDSPLAIDVAALNAALKMDVASTVDVCGETPVAIGTMEGTECVSTLPLKYEERALQYDYAPYTYYSVTENYDSWEIVGYDGRQVSTQTGWDCQGIGRLQGTECVSMDGLLSFGPATPVYSTTTVYDVPRYGNVTRQHTVTYRHGAPSASYWDNGSGWQAVRSAPKVGARIDAAFTDNSFRIEGGKYVANSPLPARDFDTANHAYKYEAEKNAYVTRNTPAVANLHKPVFGSLPSGVISWSTNQGATASNGQYGTYIGLEGDVTGRHAPSVTVHTVAGDIVLAPAADGSAKDR
jgi:hypothetical protein